MKLFSLLFLHCMNCTHYVPFFCEKSWELSECKKYGRYADMSRMDEGKCGKNARHFSPIKKGSHKGSESSEGFSMELDCM